MKWDVYKAKAWMMSTGMGHIEDGLYAEGGELVYEAKWGDGCDSEDNFRMTMDRVCCWDRDTINEAIKEVMK